MRKKLRKNEKKMKKRRKKWKRNEKNSQKKTKKKQILQCTIPSCTDAWVTRPERPKGVKDVIKQAPRLLVYIYIYILLLKRKKSADPPLETFSFPNRFEQQKLF